MEHNATGILVLIALLLVAGVGRAADTSPPELTVAPIWPESVRARMVEPGKLVITERGEPGALPDRAATGITDPDLTIFPARNPKGFALLIIPGGGYTRVVMDKEGYEAARWFADRGVSSFVLRYRLPGEWQQARPEYPLADAQRAMRWIRHHADDYGIDADSIGVMGFSAGGHLAATLATAFGRPVYPPSDEADRQSARPDFAILMYPVISLDSEITHAGSRALLLGASPPPALVEAWSPAQQIGPETPPVFLLHSADDEAVVVENSLVMYRALRAVGVKSDLHVYAEGGHGFGLRFARGLPVASWPPLVLTWILTGPHARPGPQEADSSRHSRDIDDTGAAWASRTSTP